MAALVWSVFASGLHDLVVAGTGEHPAGAVVGSAVRESQGAKRGRGAWVARDSRGCPIPGTNRFKSLAEAKAAVLRHALLVELEG